MEGHGGVERLRGRELWCLSRPGEPQIDGGAGPVSLRLDDLPDPLKPHGELDYTTTAVFGISLA